jgi:hypothetical protein
MMIAMKPPKGNDGSYIPYPTIGKRRPEWVYKMIVLGLLIGLIGFAFFS